MIKSGYTVLLLLFFFVGFAQAQGDSPVPSQAKLELAQDAAARFVKRFNETLDFGVPYHEMSLPDSRWRKGENFRNLDPRDEKIGDDFWVATMNLWYLRQAYFLTHKKANLPRDIVAAGGNELMPYLDDSKGSDPTFLPRYLRKARRLANLYRQHLPSSLFTAPAYQAKVQAVDKQTAGGKPQGRVEKGSLYYEELEGRDIYLVLCAGFEYMFLEEDGAFKVIHINPLPGFRMAP